MRYAVLLLLVTGCATQFAEAVELAETCEQKYPGQCQGYWDTVNEMDARREREIAEQPARRAVRRQRWLDRQTARNNQPPTYRCTSDYFGGSTCTPQ